tara:strand:- start:1285 stop:1458 length:174 start_codon:yes stop_codon:yes gene_type:complete
MLLCVGDDILEIRPKQIIKTKEKLDYPQLTLVEEQKKRKPKKVVLDGDISDISKTKA